MSMETRALGDAIRAARMKKGLTQDALSELLEFQSREESRCLRMDGLSEREAEALERLVDAMREK